MIVGIGIYAASLLAGMAISYAIGMLAFGDDEL